MKDKGGSYTVFNQLFLAYVKSISSYPQAHQVRQRHRPHARDGRHRYYPGAYVHSVLQRCKGSAGSIYAIVQFRLQEGVLLCERLRF